MKRRQFSETQKKNLVAKFLASGVPEKQFCLENKVSNNSMWRWRKTYAPGIPARKRGADIDTRPVVNDDKRLRLKVKQLEDMLKDKLYELEIIRMNCSGKCIK